MIDFITIVFIAMLGLPALLLLLFSVGIQYTRYEWCKPLVIVLAPALLLDVVLTRSVFLFWMLNAPSLDYWTFSQWCAGTQYQNDWTGKVARATKRVLNSIDPTHRHIHD
jgi:hypothetical protein